MIRGARLNHGVFRANGPRPMKSVLAYTKSGNGLLSESVRLSANLRLVRVNLREMYR